MVSNWETQSVENMPPDTSRFLEFWTKVNPLHGWGEPKSELPRVTQPVSHRVKTGTLAFSNVMSLENFKRTSWSVPTVVPAPGDGAREREDKGVAGKKADQIPLCECRRGTSLSASNALCRKCDDDIVNEKWSNHLQKWNLLYSSVLGVFLFFLNVYSSAHVSSGSPLYLFIYLSKHRKNVNKTYSWRFFWVARMQVISIFFMHF
jgi:hypothetical protein